MRIQKHKQTSRIARDWVALLVYYPKVSRQLEKLWLLLWLCHCLGLTAEVSKTVTGGYCSFPHCWGVQGELGMQRKRLLLQDSYITADQNCCLLMGRRNIFAKTIVASFSLLCLTFTAPAENFVQPSPTGFTGRCLTKQHACPNILSGVALLLIDV